LKFNFRDVPTPASPSHPAAQGGDVIENRQPVMDFWIVDLGSLWASAFRLVGHEILFGRDS